MKTFVSAVALCALSGVASAGIVGQTGTPGTGSGGFGTRSQVYALDDGTAENSVGLISGGLLAGINYFAVVGGNDIITSVDVAWGTPVFAGQNGIIAGAPFTVYVWANNGSGTNPSGANSTLLFSTTANVDAANIDNNTLQSIAVPNIAVGTSFFVGVSIAHAANTFPISVDQTAPTFAGSSWVGGGTSFDPNSPSFGAGPMLDLSTLGFGNWMIRANAVPTPGAAGLLALVGLAAVRRRR